MVYSVSVYVMTKSCNKTHFCMIYIVWQLFPRYLVVSVIKKKATGDGTWCVLNKGWRCRKGQKGYYRF